MSPLPTLPASLPPLPMDMGGERVPVPLSSCVPIPMPKPMPIPPTPAAAALAESSSIRCRLALTKGFTCATAELGSFAELEPPPTPPPPPPPPPLEPREPLVGLPSADAENDPPAVKEDETELLLSLPPLAAATRSALLRAIHSRALTP